MTPTGQSADEGASKLGFGGAYLAGGLETAQSIRLVHAALEAGIRHFDTAPIYGLGQSEDVLGKALKGRWKQVTLATKVGLPRSTAPPLLKQAGRLIAGPIRSMTRQMRRRSGPQTTSATAPDLKRSFDPATVELSLMESLRRLQAERVDLLLLHEARLQDITDELLSLLQGWKRSGLIGGFGLASDYPEAVAIHQAYGTVFDVWQYSWSPLDLRAHPPIPDGLQITHRALFRAFAPIRAWLRQAPEAKERLCAATGLDLGDPRQLSRVLLGAALAANPGGIVLMSSHQLDRVRDNALVQNTPALIAAGSRLNAALAKEPECPSPY